MAGTNIKIDKYKFPGGVYIPFGNSTEYNKLVLDYNIKKSYSGWALEVYDEKLRTKMPYRAYKDKESDNYYIKYQDNEYIGELNNDILSIDMSDIKLTNKVIYKIIISDFNSDIDVQEIVCAIYELFNWQNINVKTEEMVKDKEVYIYVSYSFEYLSRKLLLPDNLDLSYDVFNPRILTYIIVQLMKYYELYWGLYGNYSIELVSEPGGTIIEGYNNKLVDFDKDHIQRYMEFIIPYRYDNEKLEYTNKVIKYCTNLFEWAAVAIKMGKDLGYSDEFFKDLKESLDSQLSDEFIQILTKTESTAGCSESKLSIYDIVAKELDIVMENREITNNSETKETINNNEIKEAIKVEIPEENEDSKENTIDKLKNSIKSVSTLLDRM